MAIQFDTNKKWLYNEIGFYFKTARVNARKTQLEIASKLNVTPQYICNYEGGVAGLDMNLIRGFVKHYQMSPNAVLDDLMSLYKTYLKAELTGLVMRVKRKDVSQLVMKKGRRDTVSQKNSKKPKRISSRNSFEYSEL